MARIDAALLEGTVKRSGGSMRLARLAACAAPPSPSAAGSPEGEGAIRRHWRRWRPGSGRTGRRRG